MIFDFFFDATTCLVKSRVRLSHNRSGTNSNGRLLLAIVDRRVDRPVDGLVKFAMF